VCNWYLRDINIYSLSKKSPDEKYLALRTTLLNGCAAALSLGYFAGIIFEKNPTHSKVGIRELGLLMLPLCADRFRAHRVADAHVKSHESETVVLMDILIFSVERGTATPCLCLAHMESEAGVEPGMHYCCWTRERDGQI
jgi:hypothetical protein